MRLVLQGFFVCGGGLLISAEVIERGALRIYGSLLAERAQWRGTLVVCIGNVSLFAGAPTAVCVAGGTALVIGSSTKSIRASQREGGLDFVVNTLDEALRTLKNSVREGKALSVGLEGEQRVILAEMLERGVAPDCVLWDDTLDGSDADAVEKLVESGALSLDLIAIDRGESGVGAWLEKRGWSEVKADVDDSSALREWNRRVLEGLPADDEVRRRWLRQVPRYLRGSRNGVQAIWLSQDESQRIELRAE